jgi:hypothetical protein
MTSWCAEDQVEKFDVLPSQLRWDSKRMALGLFGTESDLEASLLFKLT